MIILMNHPISHFILAGFLVFAVAGCQSPAVTYPQPIEKENKRSVLKTYRANYDHVWDTVHNIAEGTDLDLFGVDKKKGEIFGVRIDENSFGDMMGIVVKIIDPDVPRTSVEVVSQAVPPYNTLAMDWENYVFVRLDRIIPPEK